MATTKERAATEVFAHCSFCGKDNTRVNRLVAGPGVYICDECVELCGQIIEASAAADATGDPPVPRLPEWRDLDDDQVLAHIPNIAATATRVEDSLRIWVLELRRRGVTWARIGESLDMTRQSAWERFAGEP